MKKLLSFFKQRWFISLLGIVALSLLIWFLGPLFAFAHYEPLGPELHRFVAIGLIFFFWLGARLWLFFKAQYENKLVIAEMLAGQEPAPSSTELAKQEELRILKERLQKALDLLKKARLGKGFGRRFLYQLPWYVLIGPPGSGKTTLLKNSDLTFPLAEQFGKEEIRGVGGTRNCDWFFTEEAVLLDTAGRYTTQDSHEEVDRAAWLGFLDLLKKYRRRKPINGAIIAMSLSDLLQSEAERRSHANAIRKRIRELYDHFGIRFPIYLLFTKCDLLAGFMAYFDELGREERVQVWGMTFALDEDGLSNGIARFDGEFSTLEQRLHSQLIEKLERERSPERRDWIYLFPQQFTSLRQVIAPFLREVFQPSRFEHPAMLRGVYFTSATHEGSPFDRIIGSLAVEFGLDRQRLASSSTSGKSFFINRLLREVIFAESALAGENLTFRRYRAWIQHGAFIAIAGVTALAVLAWVTSYAQNKAYINTAAVEAKDLQRMIGSLPPDQADPLSVLSLLDKARHFPGGYAAMNQDTPWSFSYGLYQGDKLGEAAVSVYRKLLKDMFLPRLMSRLEQQIREHANNTDYLYEALKVYLMLTDEKHYDRDTIRTWITLDWEQNLPLEVTNDQRRALADHLDALLENRPVPLPRPLDANLVQRAREVLINTPLAERIYGRIKLELTGMAIPDFRISDAVGRNAPLVFTRKSGDPLNEGIPGLYTYAGYHKLFLKKHEQLTKELADENWVLGKSAESHFTDAELQAVRQEVLKRYLEDYVKQWERLLADIQIVPFANLAQAVEVLNLLAGEPSPIRSLLVAVARETTLERAAEKEESWVDQAGKTLSATKSKLEKIMGKKPPASMPSQPGRATGLVSDRFKELNDLVHSGDGASPPLNSYLTLLNELHVHLNALLHASGEELVLDQRKQIAQVIEKVMREAKRAPYPLNSLMSTIAADSNSLVQGGVSQHLNAIWKTTVLPFCERAIQGRYPINRDSGQDITHEDFTYFFGPNGLMMEFFNKYLASSVDKSGSNWRWSNLSDAPAAVSSSALKQFQRADAISNIFFRMGQQVPTISFKLKPIAMSPAITQFTLDVDGQALRYAHGPIRPTPMKWPGPNNSGQLSIQLTPPNLGGTSGLTKEGPWALFRLFDQARLTRTANPEIFIVTFDIQGRDTKFEMRASSAINPFLSPELHEFRCPQNL